jgi:ABC-2 type transport system ATP-binding protein
LKTADALVNLDCVTRAFGDVVAVNDLTLRAPEAGITVLLGPNGAGKTTAIRLITGALSPDRGSVIIFGMDPAEQGEGVRLRCGVVSAKPALYDRLSGRNNLLYAAELYGLGRRVGARIDEVSEQFGIRYALDQQVGGYSTGMKTRLALARAVLHAPDLLLLDEPTSGLDPESSVAVLHMIRDMTDQGRTVVMCTHLLAEAEGLADHVVILDDGTDLMAGAPEELTRRFWPWHRVRISAEQPEQLKCLGHMPGVMEFKQKNGVEIQVDRLERVPDLVRSLAEAGVRITRVDPQEPTLEELYFAVRGKQEVEVSTGATT